MLFIIVISYNYFIIIKTCDHDTYCYLSAPLSNGEPIAIKLGATLYTEPVYVDNNKGSDIALINC